MEGNVFFSRIFCLWLPIIFVNRFFLDGCFISFFTLSPCYHKVFPLCSCDELSSSFLSFSPSLSLNCGWPLSSMMTQTFTLILHEYWSPFLSFQLLFFEISSFSSFFLFPFLKFHNWTSNSDCLLAFHRSVLPTRFCIFFQFPLQ